MTDELSTDPVIKKTADQTLPSFEDEQAGVAKVEHRYNLTPCTADTLVSSAPGLIHTVTFSCNDAVPTAGTITIYDNTAASGKKLYSETFDTTPFRGYSVVLDGLVAIGLYVDFTTTADINCNVSWR